MSAEANFRGSKKLKSIKIGIITILIGLFVFACSQSSPIGNNSNNRTITQNVNGANVSYETAETNSSNPATAANDEFTATRKIFTEKCVVCHKETGEGGKTNLDGAEFSVPSYKSDKVVSRDDKRYIRVIEEGDDEMPPFKDKLKPEEIKDLVRFIRKEFQGK